MANSPDMFNDSKIKLFSLFICFWRTSGSFFVIFSSVAPHRGQPAAKCHPKWQPTRRLAVSCGVWRRRIRTRDCRTTVWRSTIEIKLLICNPRVPAVQDEDEVLATIAETIGVPLTVLLHLARSLPEAACSAVSNGWLPAR